MDVREKQSSEKRLIDANALFKAFEKAAWYNNADRDEIAEEILEQMPTIEAEPVRYGRWECGKPCPVCGRDRFEGLDADIWADWEPQYCPNCGAKMDGGQNNER